MRPPMPGRPRGRRGGRTRGSKGMARDGGRSPLPLQAPQAGAVLEVGKATLLDAAAEGVEGAQGDVFLVGDALRGAAQGRARPLDEQPEVTLPQRLGGGAIAGTQEVVAGVFLDELLI